MERLTLTAISAGYGDEDVIHDVSLEVAAGEVLCVLGPSGGGKSTLLRVIAGLEPISAGSIVLDGRDLAGREPHERGVGLMFQDYALFPHRDVGDNVGFGLRMQGLPRTTIRARVAELLELVGLPGFERRRVAQLSGGEQQRVALARSLAPEPAVLLLDEPMGSLDRSLRQRLPDELRALFERLGLTVIYVTHDQGEALSVADRVALMHEGRVTAVGAPEALWTKPPDAWAARFLGARNVGSAVIDDARVRTPWGSLPLEAADSAPEGPLTIVMRPSAFVIVEAGPIAGRVASRRFSGDHASVTVVVDGAGTEPHVEPLYVELRGGHLPRVGDRVTLAVSPGAAHLIASR